MNHVDDFYQTDFLYIYITISPFFFIRLHFPFFRDWQKWIRFASIFFRFEKSETPPPLSLSSIDQSCRGHCSLLGKMVSFVIFRRLYINERDRERESKPNKKTGRERFKVSLEERKIEVATFSCPFLRATMEHATGNTIYVSRNPVSRIILPFHEKSIVSLVTLVPLPPPCFFFVLRIAGWGVSRNHSREWCCSYLKWLEILGSYVHLTRFDVFVI